MNVCVNGLGNIGTSLTLLLCEFKEDLKIDNIIAYKNKPQPWLQNDLELLRHKGVTVILSESKTLEDVLAKVEFVFDCTSNGMGLANLPIYKSQTHLKGAIAQGSEKGFGQAFMSNLNIPIKEKFLQIVSCNTHAAAGILNLFAGKNLKVLDKADFVVVRRSEDIGNHTRLVSANVVARHLSPDTGTHHAIDAKDLYESLGIDCNITSSDITTPSQLMHATRFNIDLKESITAEDIQKKVTEDKYMATTQKFDSNLIFELGRRYGKFGRIFEHAIMIDNNLLINQNNIKGWAFVPQEGNTLLSTLNAFLKITQSTTANRTMNTIEAACLQSEW